MNEYPYFIDETMNIIRLSKSSLGYKCTHCTTKDKIINHISFDGLIKDKKIVEITGPMGDFGYDRVIGPIMSKFNLINSLDEGTIQSISSIYNDCAMILLVNGKLVTNCDFSQFEWSEKVLNENYKTVTSLSDKFIMITQSDELIIISLDKTNIYKNYKILEGFKKATIYQGYSHSIKQPMFIVAIDNMDKLRIFSFNDKKETIINFDDYIIDVLCFDHKMLVLSATGELYKLFIGYDEKNNIKISKSKKADNIRRILISHSLVVVDNNDFNYKLDWDDKLNKINNKYVENYYYNDSMHIGIDEYKNLYFINYEKDIKTSIVLFDSQKGQFHVKNARNT